LPPAGFRRPIIPPSVPPSVCPSLRLSLPPSVPPSTVLRRHDRAIDGDQPPVCGRTRCSRKPGGFASPGRSRPDPVWWLAPRPIDWPLPRTASGDRANTDKQAPRLEPEPTDKRTDGRTDGRTVSEKLCQSLLGTIGTGGDWRRRMGNAAAARTRREDRSRPPRLSRSCGRPTEQRPVRRVSRRRRRLRLRMPGRIRRDWCPAARAGAAPVRTHVGLSGGGCT